MVATRPYAEALQRLRTAGLRPTRQRLSLAKLLFDGGDRHVTAEELRADAVAADVRVSLATVYNTLHQFTQAGLLREVSVDSGRAYFDTNVGSHHHFLLEPGGHLVDIPATGIDMGTLPPAPPGMKIDRVDVVIRLVPEGK